MKIDEYTNFGRLSFWYNLVSYCQKWERDDERKIGSSWVMFLFEREREKDIVSLKKKKIEMKWRKSDEFLMLKIRMPSIAWSFIYKTKSFCHISIHSLPLSCAEKSCSVFEEKCRFKEWINISLSLLLLKNLSFTPSTLSTNNVDLYLSNFRFYSVFFRLKDERNFRSMTRATMWW